MPATNPAPTARRAGLDRDDIVEVALHLVEREGADALSMRRLAADLDVATTTIYWHVGGRDELVAAIIERVSSGYATFTPTGRTPRARALSVARHVWATALANRQVTSLAHQSGATSLLESPLEIALARELESAGVSGAANRDAVRSILMCVGGFLVVAFRSEQTRRSDTHLRPHEVWAGVADGRLTPATLAAHRRPPDLSKLFDHTLGVLIDSFLPEPTKGTRHG